MNDRVFMRKCVKSAMELPNTIKQLMNPIKTKDNPLKGIDVEKEYELIQEKKSTLPAKMRELIVIVVENKIKYK